MKIAFVTGANKGIGYGIVRRLAKFYGRGEWDIYLTARNSDLGMEAVKLLEIDGHNVYFHQLDITDPFSRKAFLDFIRTKYPDGINVAVNNAGIAFKDGSTASFGEQARVSVHTNFTCTVEFTEEFMPLLAKNARVVNISSSLSLEALKVLSDELYQRFTSPMKLSELKCVMSEFVRYAEEGIHTEKGWPSTAYGVSKLGLTKASFILGDMLKSDPRNIIINACCPGYVDTDMTSHKGVKSIDEGADTPFYLATLPLDVSEPCNQFVYERKSVAWTRDN